jgi:hypothetical protein|tara:strand:- start:2022 stop:2264 length:243 start_codon:yes stop_codon:yes gene_type:complete
MEFKITKLANSISDSDNQIYLRLIALASRIQRLKHEGSAKRASRRGKSTLIIDTGIMVGLILPSEVSYTDEIGKVEVSYE